jgi:hypothetical protein
MPPVSPPPAVQPPGATAATSARPSQAVLSTAPSSSYNEPGSPPSIYKNINPQLLHQLYSTWQRSQGSNVLPRANRGVQRGGTPGAPPTYSRLVPRNSNNFFKRILPMLPQLIPQVMNMYKAVRTDPGMLKRYPQLANAPSANLANPPSQPAPPSTP